MIANLQLKHQMPLLGSLLVGTQITITQTAIAHTGHDHSQPKDEQSVTTETEPDVPVPPSDDLTSGTHETTIEITPTQPASSDAVSSNASLLDGFSVGFGEVIFGLILAGPLLLLSLRKRFQR